ncbi:MAG: YcxB family protein [Bacteroidia bacterium]
MRLQIDITRQDYSDFNKFHFRQTKMKRTIIIGMLTVIIVQLFLNREQFDLIATIISTIVCIVVYVFMINRSLNKTKNIPDNNGTILGEKEIDFTDDKIIYKTRDSQGSSNWNTIKNLKESPKAFYLYMDTNMAMLIPKRVFKDTNETEEFRKLVNRKINTPSGEVLSGS